MASQVKATLQSQRDLVANVSHELKTPLTSIQGFSQALLDGTADDDQARGRAAAIIHEEAGRMRHLVDELLDLARLEAGQVTLAREPVDIAELLRACAARFSSAADQAGIVVEVRAPASLPLVVGDPDRLGQVFGNLVDNAIKHSAGAPGGRRVALSAEHQDRMVVCSVTDNGPGIPADDLPRVFERFYQVDKSRARRGDLSDPSGQTRGAGLGLAIAKEIVQAHGGRITVESVEGLGTRFVVYLPVQPGIMFDAGRADLAIGATRSQARGTQPVDIGGESWNTKSVRVDGQMLSTGIRQAVARSEDSLICFVKPDTIRFVAVSGLRMVVSWETQLQPPAIRQLGLSCSARDR